MRQRGNFDRTWTSAAALAGAVVMGLAAPGCAREAGMVSPEVGRPAWIDSPREGASERTLIGVGVGPTRDAAIDAAMARLAQSIEVRVIARDETRTTGHTAMTRDGHFATAASELNRSVRLLADQRLAAVRIERTWRNPLSGEWNARVQVDRAQAAHVFNRRAMDLLRDAEAAADRAARASGWSSVVGWRDAATAAGRAMEAARTRDALWGEPWEASVSFLSTRATQMLDAWDAARADARIAVRWTSVDGAVPGRMVADRVGALGLLTLAGDADLLISCDLRLETGGAFDGRTRATRWTLVLRAVTAEDRRLVASLQESGNTVSRSDSERAARAAALRRLETSLPQFLDQIFNESRGLSMSDPRSTPGARR